MVLGDLVRLALHILIREPLNILVVQEVPALIDAECRAQDAAAVDQGVLEVIADAEVGSIVAPGADHAGLDELP